MMKLLSFKILIIENSLKQNNNQTEDEVKQDRDKNQLSLQEQKDEDLFNDEDKNEEENIITMQIALNEEKRNLQYEGKNIYPNDDEEIDFNFIYNFLQDRNQDDEQKEADELMLKNEQQEKEKLGKEVEE